MSKRGRPSSDEHEDLFAQVNVRFTEAERLTLGEMCEDEGVTLSAFVRAKVFGKRLASKTDLTAIRELRRQGGLLKHLCYEGLLDPDLINSTMLQIDSSIVALKTGSEVAGFRNEIKDLAKLVYKMNKDGVVNPERALAVLKALEQAFKRFKF